MTTPADDKPRDDESSQSDDAAESNQAKNTPNADTDQPTKSQAESPGADTDAAASDTKDGDTKESESKDTDSSSADTSTDTSTDTGTKTDDDGLPEWEPLTPEDVEDEAIRGDFMLRWAVVLLALLFGCTEIADTATLLHVKTGQYLASNGYLPPANDVFSSTVPDRAWVNLSWLYDLTTAAVFGVRGAVTLSLFTAIVASVVFYLIVSTNRPNVSSWWTAVCAGLTLMACFPQLTARPELITLLGLAVTLWLLQRWRFTDEPKNLAWLIPVFLLWSNLDSRMFLGLSLLLLYGIGDLVGSISNRPSLPGQAERKQLWMAIGGCCIAALLNPFGWNSLLAPFRLFGSEYPALRDYYGLSTSVESVPYFSIFSSAFWNSLSVYGIAGLLVLTIGAVTLVLNRAKLEMGDLFVFVGFCLFAVLTSHELAAACVVACVIGNLNAQLWYQTNFRQDYTVEVNELIFSRGGRAITVLALFALAFLAITGRMVGANGRRIGLGFDHGLQANIDGLNEELADAFDDHPFHFRLQQGDLLIWTGKKSFIDSRIGLFVTGGENLLELHNKTRYALRRATANTPVWTGNESIWKDVFNRFKVTHVLPRMGGSNPDYVTLQDLISSPGNWAFTKLGATTAVFYRKDLRDKRLQKYLEEHPDRRLELVKQTFQTDTEATTFREDWPRPPSFYQKYLSLPKPETPNLVREAGHYLRAVALTNHSGAQAALAIQAIRKANAGLAENPYSTEAFLILGHAYALLEDLEKGLSEDAGVPYTSQLRFHQSVQALNQALIIEPLNPLVNRTLIDTFLGNNKLDLALRAIEAFQEATDGQDARTQDVNFQRRNVQMQQHLTIEADKIAKSIETALKQHASRVDLAQQVYQAGFVLQALQVLEDDPIFLSKNQSAQLLQAMLLMEVGRSEEASVVFDRIEGFGALAAMLDWREPAAWAKLANAEYDRAIQLYQDQINVSEQSRMSGILSTLPLIQPAAMFVGEGRNIWPVQQTFAIADSAHRVDQSLASLRLSIALCSLETGHIKEATKQLQHILKESPETQLRPVVRFYLYQVTEDLIDLEPPSDWIPITADVFQPETKPEPEPKTSDPKN